MIKPDQIPDEVVEAAARAAWGVLRAEDEWLLKTKARAAIAAALSAWPGAFPWTFNGPLEGTGYVLPVPTEVSDD